MSKNPKLDSHTIAKAIKGECAPTVKGDVCSTKETLEDLRDKLDITARTPKEIVNAAKEKTGCTTESCTLKKVGLLADAEDRFRPAGPWNNKNWLNNSDIDEVLEQYVAKFPRFKHIPFQMRDFADQGGELARVAWPEVSKKYDALACVLNTDLSSGSGEHWTPIFVDFRNGTVEYFDSAGQTPHKEFTDFVVKVAHELSQSGRKFRDVILTQVDHQHKNTECGVYSLYYIISRLHGVPYTAFTERRVPDELMEAFRKSLFRNS